MSGQAATAAIDPAATTRPKRPTRVRIFDAMCVLGGLSLVTLASAMLTISSTGVAWPNHFALLAFCILGAGFAFAAIALSADGVKLEFVASIVLACVLGALLLAKIGPSLDDLLRTQWKADRNAFIHRATGFPMLRRLAHDQYGLDLELAPFSNDYLVTTHRGPGSSVGVMTLYPGYCELSLWPEGTAASFMPYKGDPELPHDRRIDGIAFHELGHCVDMARDQPSFKDPTVFGTHSIAPGDRLGVVDLHTFAQAQQIPRTQLWQETYADLYAIGMIRLTWSHDDAHAFFVMIRRARLNNADIDATHDTTCWLDAAWATPAPKTVGDVAGWAEHLREATPCKVTVPTTPDEADVLPTT